MTTPNTKNGITKDSTLVVNVAPYLPTNYKQTLNYVGYWKWDSTNQNFVQVLNNQDIIDENYNIKIQPLFYDADTGLPQKVTVNSGNTKRLKMINDNNDGSMEPVEYIENNTMVRFNSKTRSVTEYPYFEVEALPPTIISPITSNGYYKFDGNTLIPGTNQDYNIYINISNLSLDYLYLSKIEKCDSNGNIISYNDKIIHHITDKSSITLNGIPSGQGYAYNLIIIEEIFNNNYIINNLTSLNAIYESSTKNITPKTNNCYIIEYKSSNSTSTNLLINEILYYSVIMNYNTNTPINSTNSKDAKSYGSISFILAGIIDDVTQANQILNK